MPTVKVWHTKLDHENRFQTSCGKPEPKRWSFRVSAVSTLPDRLTATHSHTFRSCRLEPWAMSPTALEYPCLPTLLMCQCGTTTGAAFWNLPRVAAGGSLEFLSLSVKVWQRRLWKFPSWSVFSALGEVNLLFTLMVSSTVMVDIVFACPVWCSFY